MATRYQINVADPRNHCMLATQVIRRGSEILSEVPLINLDIGLQELVDNDDYFGKAASAIAREVNALEPERHQLWTTLRNSSPKQGIMGIVETNAFSEDEHRQVQIYQRTIIYNDISKINHSCHPNAELHWNVQTNTGTICAVSPIGFGEEITINYLGDRSSLATRRSRQKEVQKRWRFHCACSICTLQGPQQIRDDDLRKQARNLYDKIATHASSNVRINQQRTLAVQELNAYIRILDQLHIRDGRLAFAYDVLQKTHAELFEYAQHALAAGLRHEGCNCDGFVGGAIWHLRSALSASVRCLELDTCVHAAGHPQIQMDLNRIHEMQVLIIRAG